MLARKWAFILAAYLGLCGYMEGVSAAIAQAVRKDPLTQQEVPTQVDRVPAHPDFSVTARLSGGLPAWANAANDAGTALGVVPPETLIHMNFVLTRAPQLEAAFNQLLNDQQNPASPRFHHWLTPQQVGVYGPTQHDIDALSSWLSTQGITVEGIAPSRTSLEASAPASVVSRVLAISFRYFKLPTGFAGTPKLLLSATSEPALPTALIPLVMGISGLSEIPVHSMVRGVTSTHR